MKKRSVTVVSGCDWAAAGEEENDREVERRRRGRRLMRVWELSFG